MPDRETTHAGAAPFPEGEGVTADSVTHPAVSLTNVTRHFGRFAALRGITAEFFSGKLYTIIGDNGAGKSTLLRIVAGLIQPTKGKVEVLGSSNLRAIRSAFGYMAHAPLLYDELTAVENMEYFAQLYSISDKQLCRKAIRTVGLDPDLDRRVGQFSQGMRQRLSLARAILHDPKLILLDEPFSNVDITSAREMVRLLGTMRDTGKTIFLVTHQPSLLEGVADEFVQMDSGRIVGRCADLGSTAVPAAGETPSSPSLKQVRTIIAPDVAPDSSPASAYVTTAEARR